MDDDLRVLVQKVIAGSTRIKATTVDEVRGRGHTLIDVLLSACLRVEVAAEAILTELPLANPALEPIRERELFRQLGELEMIHEFLAHFSGDSGRTDLPVGITYLIDELIRDLLPRGADPIIHLDVYNMYSTLPIVDAASSLLQGSSPPDPHPVAFNLPALDPNNVMLSPILAHEVGHVAWKQGLDITLNSEADLATAGQRLRDAIAGTGFDQKKLAEQFDSWRQELLCDAIATVLTGPSLLFASAVFLPLSTGVPAFDTHPYPRDRVAYTLRILDQLGWTPFLKAHVPKIFAWCESLAKNVRLSGTAAETGLREAIQVIEPAITKVARGAVKNEISREALESKRTEVNESLELGVLPVELSDGILTPWETIAAAWMYEIERIGDEPQSLVRIASNAELNGFLVKSIELTGIRKLWSEA